MTEFEVTYAFAGATKNKIRYDAVNRAECHGAHVVYVDKDLFPAGQPAREIVATYRCHGEGEED